MPFVNSASLGLSSYSDPVRDFMVTRMAGVMEPRARADWDASSRVARVTFPTGGKLSTEDATAMVEAVTRAVPLDGAFFGVLMEGRGVRGVDAGYRATMRSFFLQHRKSVALAYLDVPPVTRVILDMFRRGTSIPTEAFDDEPAALAWLRTHGVPA